MKDEELDKLYQDFQKELAENDRLVEKEMETKTRAQIFEDYNNFIKQNHCKIKETNNATKKSTKK